MRLINRARELRYIYGWRLRYWWMDTERGRHARLGILAAAVLVAIYQVARMAVEVLVPPAAGEPVRAYWWVVQLIIMVVAAVIAYALRPDPPKDAPRKTDAPTVEDGTPIKDYGGTFWIDHDDNRLLAWKVVGQDPIKSESGK